MDQRLRGVSKDRSNGTDWLASIAMTALGIILSMVPVLLWVAWSPRVFMLVLLVTVVSVALLIALNDHQESAVADQQAVQHRAPMSSLPDQFFVEIHRIFPLNYHHSRLEKAQFRRVMEKIRRLAR